MTIIIMGMRLKNKFSKNEIGKIEIFEKKKNSSYGKFHTTKVVANTTVITYMYNIIG